jgi:hypothetical protein
MDGFGFGWMVSLRMGNVVMSLLRSFFLFVGSFPAPSHEWGDELRIQEDLL